MEIDEEEVHLSVFSDLGVSKIGTIRLRDDYAKAYESAEDESLFGINIFSSRYEVVDPENSEPRRIHLTAPDDWLTMHYQQCCYWVEHSAPPRYGRAYVLEAPERNIEILDVRTDLGTKEAFTMTVSSINDAVVKQSIGKVRRYQKQNENYS